MRRRLVNFATAISLLLCVATMVLWARSYSARQRHIIRLAHFGTVGILASHGEAVVSYKSPNTVLGPYWRWFDATPTRFNRDFLTDALDVPVRGKDFTPPESTWKIVRSHTPDEYWTVKRRNQGNGLGFVYELVLIVHMDGKATIETRRLLIPQYGFLLIPTLAAIPPAFWLRRFRRRQRRQAAGRCLACGYSLTGNTSGICPECGVPVPTTTQAAI